MDRIPVPGAIRAHIVSVHYVRWQARRAERKLQPMIGRKNSFEALFASEQESPDQVFVSDQYRAEYDSLVLDLHAAGVPKWANGVRVMKAGGLSWAVVATENKGH